MDGPSAKVNGLPKRAVYEIKSLPFLNQKLNGPNDVLGMEEVNYIPKSRPLSHDRSLSQNIPLQGLSIFRLFLIMHSLIEEQIHINVRWRHQIISELICKWMGHA